MPILPKLIGGIEIRERRKRYPGEPRYKRLDFIKPRTTIETDEWNVIQTTQPIMTVRQYGPPWHHPQWNLLSHEQQQQILNRLGYHQQIEQSRNQQYAQAQEHQQQHIPVPPLHSHNHQLGYHDNPQRRIENVPGDRVVAGNIGDDDGDNGDEIVQVIELC